MDTLILSKFDVAERQLLQSINMFFREEDPVSIHTLAEAASQVLMDIGKEYGAKSFLKDNDLIRDDKKKEWRSHMSKSKNFFKHADTDKDDKHEFKLIFNDFSIFDGMNMHNSIKKQWVPETLAFSGWFGVAHSALIKNNSDFSNLLNNAKQSGRLPDPKNKQLICELITALRNGSFSVEGVSLKYGL